MRFIIVFLLSITTSWAMNEDMEVEQAETAPLLRNVNLGPEDQAPLDADSEEKDHLSLGANPCVRDMVSDIKGEVQNPLSLPYFPTLIEELFKRLVYDAWQVDPRSIGHLFLTSKLLNEKIRKLHLNVGFPTYMLSLSPHVSEILDVIKNIESYHLSEGSLIASYIKQRFLESPSYK